MSFSLLFVLDMTVQEGGASARGQEPGVGMGLSLNTTDLTQQKHLQGWIDGLAIKYLLFKCEDWRTHINGGLPVVPASGGRGRGSPEQAEHIRELWV